MSHLVAIGEFAPVMVAAAIHAGMAAENAVVAANIDQSIERVRSFSDQTAIDKGKRS